MLKSAKIKIVTMEDGKEETPVLSHLGINIGKLFIHLDKVWVRTGRYSAAVIGEDSQHSCYFSNLLDYINDHSGSALEYLEFTILNQDIIHNLLLEHSKGEKL